MAIWSIVKVSELERTRRVDAEFYRPEYLEMDKVIRGLKAKSLAELCHVSDGNHASISEWFSEAGVRYLRGQDITDYFIGDASPVYIPETLYHFITPRGCVALTSNLWMFCFP